MTSTTCLLMNFALTEANICCILSIDLSCLYSSNPAITTSQFLYKKSIVTIIAMLFQISLFDMIATWRYLYKN